MRGNGQSTTASQSTHGSLYVVPSKSIPSRFRTVLCAPSQPTTRCGHGFGAAVRRGEGGGDSMSVEVRPTRAVLRCSAVPGQVVDANLLGAVLRNVDQVRVRRVVEHAEASRATCCRIQLIQASTFLPKVAEIRQRAAELHREQRRALREAEEPEAIEAYGRPLAPSPTGPAEIQAFVGQGSALSWERCHHQRQVNAEAIPAHDPSTRPIPEWCVEQQFPLAEQIVRHLPPHEHYVDACSHPCFARIDRPAADHASRAESRGPRRPRHE